MKKIITVLLLAFAFANMTANLNAQERKPLDNRVNLMLGVGQIVVGGYNVEANIFYKRFAFDYSHGASLDFANDALEAGGDKDQGLAIHLPWTTGFGIGYRFTESINLRVEPKWHRFELYYDSDDQNEGNLIAGYTTFTLGLGLYGDFRPFKNQDNFLKGIMIAPNVRWWPNLSSSLDDDKFTYENTFTGQPETHEARSIGIANTPIIVNISVGYSIAF